MRVAVTGSGGRLGRAVTRDLLAHGHRVVGVDQRTDDDATLVHAHFVQADVRDVDALTEAFAGCDALIHTAAIPSPEHHPPSLVYANNTGATYAALEAAGRVGIRRAAVASSLSALGTGWAPEPLFPRYAPVDEAHPCIASDAYSLSKQADEAICATVHRAMGGAMRIVALRFAWIISRAEQLREVALLRDDPALHARALWAYVDERDAAAACRLVLHADGTGIDIVTITAADTWIDLPTDEALRRYAPAVERRGLIEGLTTAFSLVAAGRVLGYTPGFSWRDPAGVR